VTESGGTPAAPAITQNSGTTYDIMLYQALVNSSGTVTLTDERVWAVAHTDGTTLTSSAGNLKIKDDGVDSDQIAAGAIDNEHIRDSAGLSVLGRAAASTGDIGDIAAGTDGHVLRRNGATLGFGTVDSDGIAAGAIDLAHMSINSVDSDQYVDDSIDTAHIAHGAIGPDQIAAGAVNHTGLDTDCVRGENIVDDQIDSEHYVDGSIDNEHLRDSAALSVLGRSANSTGDIADIAAAADGAVLRRSGTTLGFGTVSAAGIATAAIEQVKLHPGASKIIQRQGGDATDWYVNGTNNYSLASSIASIQTGSIASGSGSDVTVTFGAAFSGVPIVLITWEHVASGEWLVVTEVTAAHVVFSIKNAAGTKVARQASWMALGPYIEPG
jgi:hypothetical protein